MRKNVNIFYIIVLFYFLFIPYLYAENFENPVKGSDIDSILGELDNIYNELNLEKDIDSEIESLKREKEFLKIDIEELESNNKTELNNNISSYSEIIENSKRMKKDIDDLYSQVEQKSNTSEILSKRIDELDKDLNNERAEINDSEYETINNEIDRENRKIIETGEQIKKRREESKKLKSKIIILDETLENYRIRDGFRDKFVETYKTHFKAEIENKPDKSAKLVVLTQKINLKDDNSKETGLIFTTVNTLETTFKDCLIQYYIPLENIKPRDIKYNFKDNCLIINSPRPVLDEDMLFIPRDPNKIVENKPKGWFKGNVTEDLRNERDSEITEKLLRTGRNDRLYGEAEESARFHLENFFRGFMKGIKGSSDVKIKINFY